MARIYELKFKIGRLNWKKILFDIKDDLVTRRFYIYKFYHRNLSDNRCAYYVIRRMFSTTAINGFKDCVAKGLPGVGLCYFRNEL